MLGYVYRKRFGSKIVWANRRECDEVGVDLPLPCHPLSYWLRLFSSQTFSHVHTPTFLKPSHSTPTGLWRWNRQCSKTLAYKIQTPGNCPVESMQHSEHGESLKSRISYSLLVQNMKFLFFVCSLHSVQEVDQSKYSHVSVCLSVHTFQV